MARHVTKSDRTNIGGPSISTPRTKVALNLEGETSMALENALKGDRIAIEDIWRMIEAENATVGDHVLWVQEIAKFVVAKLLDNPKALTPYERGRAALEALGLSGHGDKLSRLNDDVGLIEDFVNAELIPRQNDIELARTLQRSFSEYQNTTPKDLAKRIGEARIRFK